MARYELDVDSPFPKPEPAEKDSAPADMDYPNAQSRVGHYGKTTLDLIEAAKAMEDGEEKQVLVVKLANLMKRHFLTWNRNTVEDSVIAAELKAKSGGALVLPEGVELEGQADILRNVRKTSDALGTSPQEEKEASLSRAERRLTFPRIGVDNPDVAHGCAWVGPRNSGAWEVSSLRAARGCKGRSFPRVRRTRRCRFCAR